MVKEGLEHQAGDEKAGGKSGNGRAPLTSLLFRHKDLLQAAGSATLVGKKELTNTLHYLHFMNGSILVHATDQRYGEDLLLKAQLVDCPPGEILCRWTESPPPFAEGLKIPHVVISDGLSLILLDVQPTKVEQEGFAARLPEQGRLLGQRRVRRHEAQGIKASLTQSGFLAQGELVDFNPLSFRVRLHPDSGSFVWMNTEGQCMIYLEGDGRILFSGMCRFLRMTGTLFEREVVLAPVGYGIKRFQKKKVRTPRVRIVPPPTAHFANPFTKKPLKRDIQDLTFTGFAVEESAVDGELMPGMIIPALEIRYAQRQGLLCDVQVIYRREIKGGRVRCGLAILDMDFPTYRRLSHLLVHAADPHACFTSDVNMDDLWEFLFKTGFIYPKKYHLLRTSRGEFKKTYENLYREEQEIEAHFTYQENGRLYGHVSIFRAYQRAWMVHHLAARPLGGKRTGLIVLKNVVRFFDGLYRFPSVKMDYMFFYFRPENHFPNLFFGGFARHMGNQRACSLDLFAYLSRPSRRDPQPLPPGWEVADFAPSHLGEVEDLYRHASGGLLLDMLRLGHPPDDGEPLQSIYGRYGLQRDWHTYCLTHNGDVKALIIVNLSSPGLNMAELLNSITVLVIDQSSLPWGVLEASLTRFLPIYQTDNVAVLIYPSTYPASQGISVEKNYLLWILDTQYGKEYMEYMEDKTRLTPRFLLKYLLRRFVRK